MSENSLGLDLFRRVLEASGFMARCGFGLPPASTRPNWLGEMRLRRNPKTGGNENEKDIGVGSGHNGFGMCLGCEPAVY
jgi:hypothetical protein